VKSDDDKTLRIPEPIVVEAASEQVSGALAGLSSNGASDNLDAGMIYEIRYNEERIRGCPLGSQIIDAYAKLLKARVRDSDNIVLRPSKRVGLISISSYKGISERDNDKKFGEGVVNVEGDIKDASLLNILNVAFAASNIRLAVTYSNMDDSEKKLIRFIKDECAALTGSNMDGIKDDLILEFIKNIPKAAPLSVDVVEFNSLVLEKLQQAA
jgi:hypothetical protein